MKTVKIALLMAVLCAVTTNASVAQLRQDKATTSPPPLGSQPLPNSLLSEERLGNWLVEAQSVAEDTSNPRFSLSIVQITHNYTGPPELVGQRFTPHGQFYTGAPLFALMPRGSKGIFVIRWFGEGLVTGPTFLDVLGYDYPFPSLEKKDMRGGWSQPTSPPLFPQARSYAQSIERVAKAPREEQIRWLKTYTTSVTPELSVWAIKTLGQSDVAGIEKFLLGLVSNKRVPTEGQLALDEQLETLNQNNKIRWNVTPARFNLWRRLLSRSANEPQASAIARRLSQVKRGDEHEGRLSDALAPIPKVSSARLFAWTRLAVANQSWPPSSRSQALSFIRELSAEKSIPRDEQWNYLLPLVKAHPEFSGRITSAPTPPNLLSPNPQRLLAIQALYLLPALYPFSPLEIAVLRELQGRAQTPDFKAEFTRLFETITP